MSTPDINSMMKNFQNSNDRKSKKKNLTNPTVIKVLEENEVTHIVSSVEYGSFLRIELTYQGKNLMKKVLIIFD